MKHYGYVYKTTDLITGMFYIGQHKGEFDAEYIGSGVRLSRAINKRGVANFKTELLAYANSKSFLNRLEVQYIAESRQKFGKRKLYNITCGGDGSRGKDNGMYGRCGDKHPSYGRVWIYRDKTTRKIKRSELNTYVSDGWIEGRMDIKGRKNGRYGTNAAKETRDKLRNFRTGMKVIHNLITDEEKSVKAHELENYLSNGWAQGFSIAHSNKMKENHVGCAGKHWKWHQNQ